MPHADPAKSREYQRAYRIKHAERIRANAAARYQADREHRLARQAAYHKARPEARKEYSAAYYVANRETLSARQAARQRVRYQADPGSVQAKNRAWQYAVPVERILELRAKTTCAICGVHLAKPHIDHCHATGKVRDVLCPRCNLGLGFVERAGWLPLALAYIKKHEEET